MGHQGAPRTLRPPAPALRDSEPSRPPLSYGGLTPWPAQPLVCQSVHCCRDGRLGAGQERVSGRGLSEARRGRTVSEPPGCRRGRGPGLGFAGCWPEATPAAPVTWAICVLITEETPVKRVQPPWFVPSFLLRPVS